MSRISLLYWACVTIFLALAVHLVTVFTIPRFSVQAESSLDEIASFPGQPAVLPDPRPGAQAIPSMDPFFLYTVCPYDISEDALTVSVPEFDGYWSLAFYDTNRTTFYAINDRSAGGNAGEIYLMSPTQVPTFWSQFPIGGTPPLVIEAQETRGIVLFRVLVEHRSQREVYLGFANEFTCSAVSIS